jgi:hypothetical protein
VPAAASTPPRWRTSMMRRLEVRGVTCLGGGAAKRRWRHRGCAGCLAQGIADGRGARRSHGTGSPAVDGAAGVLDVNGVERHCAQLRLAAGLPGGPRRRDGGLRASGRLAHRRLLQPGRAGSCVRARARRRGHVHGGGAAGHRGTRRAQLAARLPLAGRGGVRTGRRRRDNAPRTAARRPPAPRREG